MAPGEFNPEEFGHLKGTVESVQRDIETMQSDISELKKDVHDIAVMVAELKAGQEAIRNQPKENTSDTMFAVMVCVLAAGALYMKVITQWPAVVLVFAAGIIKQHADLNKLASTITSVFKRNGINGNGVK